MRHKPTEAHERPFSFYASVGMRDDDWQSFLGTLGGGDPAAGQKRLEGYAALRDCLKQGGVALPKSPMEIGVTTARCSRIRRP